MSSLPSWAFPTGRETNYTRYIKTDLEAPGELLRVPKRLRKPIP